MSQVAVAPVHIQQLELGPMQNFVYLIGDPISREAVVVDPAWEIDRIAALVEQEDWTLKGALITHFHPDHLGGNFMGRHIEGAAELLARNFPIKVYIHKAEAGYVHRITDISHSDLVLTDASDEIKIGDIPIQLLHTPGHTPGSQCFLVDGKLISGDTLFIGACGRVDLPGSDPNQMYDSLVNKLRRLPDETVLYPGHNYAAQPSTTMGEEKQRNPFLRFERVEDFLRTMGY